MSGELESAFFEETTRRNVLAAVAHGNETRRMMHVLEKQVQELKDLIVSKDREIKQVKSIAVLALQQSSRGGTSGD